jgi:threonine aldolase
MIDLRSDTFTKPSKAMKEAMLNADVGDDVWGEDPTVNRLQRMIAELFGKEESLFVPSGTMANQIGILVNTEQGDEVICEADSHIFFYETAGPAILSKVQLRPLPSQRGEIPISEIEKAIRPDVYYFPKTALICLENTHNRHGGAVLSLAYIKKVRKLADTYNLRLHLDGARIWNAMARTSVSVKEYASYFDTVQVCLSKGMGAPVGSLIMGRGEDMQKALKWRKILGGGMRQAGFLAAAGIFALENHVQLMASDNQKALIFAGIISKSPKIELELSEVESNMVTFKLVDDVNANSFVEKCEQEKIMLIHIGENKIRTVFYLDISEGEAITAGHKIIEICKEI